MSPLGATQTFNTNEDRESWGLGRGVAQAGHDLQRFLLDLGKQAVPAVEVGAMRPVTVVISEGVDLEIKEKKNGCLRGRHVREPVLSNRTGGYDVQTSPGGSIDGAARRMQHGRERASTPTSPISTVPIRNRANASA